jgi:hypothetical protein
VALEPAASRLYGRIYQRAVRRGRSRRDAAEEAREAVKRGYGLTIRQHPRQARGAISEEPLKRRCDLGIAEPQHIFVPPDRLADAERIRHMSHSSIVGELMGDPLPGRSALDKRR